MRLCDFCYSTEPSLAPIDVNVGDLIVGLHFDVCPKCQSKLKESMERAINSLRRNTDAKEACPSLTPDQAAKVSAYLSYRGVNG